MSRASAGSRRARPVRIRPAQARDVPDIHRLIHDLAVYEREPQSCTCTPRDLRDALFPTGRAAAVFALVAESADQAAPEATSSPTRGSTPSSTSGPTPDSTSGSGDPPYRVVGMAVWYLSFSTWTGRHGVWLEDLYVEPAYRGDGLGKALLVALATVCATRGYPRFEWWVLDWNSPSIEFYQALGAAPEQAWTTYRLDGEALQRLANLWSGPEGGDQVVHAGQDESHVQQH